MEPKYKIKDWVRVWGDNAKFHIIGIHTDECSVGIQTSYDCRGCDKINGRYRVASKTIRFNKIEIECLTTPPV